MKKIISVSVAAAFGLGVAGCQEAQNNPKTTIGTVVGAAGGAAAGSTIGQGSGKVVAVAIGTLLGAMVGREIGKSLDRADQAAIARTEQKALDDNVRYSWENPNTGNYGAVEPTRTFTSTSGSTCREFTQTVTIDGRPETAVGTACQQSDGTWRIQSS